MLRLILLAAALLLNACEQTPTGRNQLALVPDSVMTDMGRSTFAQMKRTQPVSADDAINARVQCIADAIVAASRRHYPEAAAPERWDVVVFEDPTPNAFALPGGHIGVHSGILEVAETPGQLAAIVGHEVGHLLADHGNERMTQQLGIRVGLMLIGLLGEVESEALFQALGIGAQIGIALPFSRAHEREADVIGLHLVAAAGFAPEESVALWRNMARADGGQPIELLSTHPAHESRIADLRARVPEVARRHGRNGAPPC